MIQGGLIKILNEIENMKKFKDNVMKEEKQLYEKFEEFSNSFDILYEEFCNYISPIKDSGIIDDEIRKNIKVYRTKIINKIENFKNFKSIKIFELSKLFNENVIFNTINELIDDTLEKKFNINQNESENENLSFTKSIDKNYSIFYEGMKSNENSITKVSEKQKNNSEIDIINNNTNTNTIKEILKCYGCENEGILHCTNKECCNFLFCKNCSEICCKNEVKINHNLKKVDEEEYKDKERKKKNI